MTKAAIYARYSPGPNQREESIEAQVHACTNYCMEHNYTITSTYVDQKMSGASDKRPSFKKMINDAKRGKFDILVIHKIDRFARDRYDDAYYKRELDRANVKRVSVVETFGSGPQAEFVENIMADCAAYFLGNLKNETRKGLETNARHARSCGGRPCLGYDLDKDGYYIVNNLEAPIVHTIFDLYDKGYTYKEIIAAMEPYRTKRGGRYKPNSIHDILRNEKYAGIFVYNKRDYSKSKVNSHTFKPREDWIVVEGGCPNIVDRELWLRVQKKMDGRKFTGERARQKAKHVYLLSGLIKCGNCGLAYAGNSLKRKDGYSWSWYECGSRKKHNNCGNIRIGRNEIESQVLSYISEALVNGREELISKLLVASQIKQKRINVEVDNSRSRIRQLEGEISNLVMSVRKGLGSNTLLKELDRVEKELDAARGELNKLEAEGKESKLNRNHVEKYLNYLTSLLAEDTKKETDLTKLKLLVGRFVQEVRVFPSKLEVDLRFDGPGEGDDSGPEGGIMDTIGSPKGMPTVSMIIPLFSGPHRAGMKKAAHPGG